MTTLPTLKPMPKAPSRLDSDETFSKLADASAAAQVQLEQDLNAFIEALNPLLDSILSAPDSAQQARVAMEQAKTIAATLGSQAGLPALTGKKGKALVVAQDEQSVLFGDVGQKVGDILFTAGNPGPTYVQTGRVYQQSAYPDLFAKVGLLGDNFSGAASAVLYTGPTTWAVGGSNSQSSVVKEGKAGVRLSFNNSKIVSIEATPKIKLPFPSGAGGGGFSSLDTDGNGIWLAGTASGYLFRSVDNGETWSAPIQIINDTNANVVVKSNRNGSWLILGSTSTAGQRCKYAVLSDVTGELSNTTLSLSFAQDAKIYQVEVDAAGDFVVGCSQLQSGYSYVLFTVISPSNPGAPVQFRPQVDTAANIAVGAFFVLTDRYILMMTGNSGEFLYLAYTSKTSYSNRVNKSSVLGAVAGYSYTRVTLLPNSGARIKDGVVILGATLTQNSGNPIGVALISRDGGINYEVLYSPGVVFSAFRCVAYSAKGFDFHLELDSTNGKLIRFSAAYSYDTATQFLTPTVQSGGSVIPYIKAAEVL